MSAVQRTGAVAIVPVKALHRAKGRLAPDLDPASRRTLAERMFARVVEACRAAREIDELLVVAGDEAAAELARGAGAACIVEALPGLRAAMAAADEATAGVSTTLVVAADLPLASAEDLDTVCRAGASPSCVVVAPTRDGGTGALLRRPPTVIATAYGPASAAAHLAAARAAGVRGIRLHLPRLSMDVDTADHLREAASQDPSLAGWGALRRGSGLVR